MKKNKRMLSSFSIIFIIIVVLGIATHFLPQAQFEMVDGVETVIPGTGVVAASLSTILMSPINGFMDAIDVSIFILVLGGFLAIVNGTGAFENGIKVLIKKLKGNEIYLIPILMFIFSVGGTTYGMLEESVVFYAILAVTMVAAGMDTLVASSIVLLGAGSGVLGSTVNPFAVGAAISSLPEDIVVNQGTIILIGLVLWLSTLLISIFFVMQYARKVLKDKGSTFLSLQEQEDMNNSFSKNESLSDAKLSSKQSITLILFTVAFIVMIVGFIPWGEFGITIFDNYTAWLTGQPFGAWWFGDAALWFLICGIIIAVVNRIPESKIVSTFIEGAADMVSVILIIAIARGASVLMVETSLSDYIIINAAQSLNGLSAIIFTPLNYLLHVGVSILVPSSSGLASLSTPIMGPLAMNVGYSVEATVMTFVAANGLVNLITPTCGAIMGGLALAKVEYTTWARFAIKVVLTIAVVNIIILTIATLIL